MTAGGFRLSAAHEWVAHDPFGRVKPADAAAQPEGAAGAPGEVQLRAARNGYASFRVLVTGAGEYRLAASARCGLEVDLFKAWYHRMHQAEGQPAAWWPDALVPVHGGAAFRLPDPENRIEGQTAQEFWVDVFIPPEAKPGRAAGRLRLTAGGGATELPFSVEILEAGLPDEPCVQMDNNSYGSKWLVGLYPEAFARAASGPRWQARTIELLQHHYRLIHEHRATFHNLGAGHSGGFDPIYGPRLAGRGRELRLEGWELFDRHYGPLLDGSAFRRRLPGSPPPRRPAAPVWGVYTPINPDWPASYLWWGEPGYGVEFTRGVGQFDAHLRANGWTGSRLEFFFNHKKRYRWFEWDGDEVKYAKDDAYHLEMGRLLKQATAGSPVKWVYRMDASWQMKNQFDRLAGSTNFWVCGGFLRWYPEEVRRVLGRGDIVWWYGGTPSIAAATSSILQNLFQTWARGLGGFCAWLTTSPGQDPWFDCEGGTTAVMYPGERFGIAGPIPSVRLKVQRNGIQDVDLVDRAARAAGRLEEVRGSLAQGVPLRLWEPPPRAALELPPEDWDSINLSAEHEPGREPLPEPDPSWWARFRQSALAGR